MTITKDNTENQKGHLVILAGGQGTRFWPMSRQNRPKQFLSIEKDGESFIQLTVRRVLDVQVEGSIPPLVVTNVAHEKMAREHIPKAQFICEPCGKNTAPSIALAALWLRKQRSDAPMIVLPSDHVIKNEEGLRKALRQACAIAAKSDVLVTVGIKPTSPHTGYGYIKRGDKFDEGSFKVARFFEKPNQERATEYVESGDFWWNGGMFVWRPSVILSSIEQIMPELYAELMALESKIGTVEEQKALEAMFSRTQSQSIDFGILEHAKNCVVVPSEDLQWDDVGSWDSWAKLFTRDANANLFKGDVVGVDSHDCVVLTDKKPIAVVGLSNIVVIDAGDAILVCAEDKVQDVKKVVEALKAKGRKELL